MTDKNSININLIPDLPDSTKEAVLNPTANLVGQAFRGITHKVLGPLIKYNIIKDAELRAFTEKTREKTEAIPLENRDDSQIGLTYKAVEDAAYQLSSEEMRELFANLISATVDNRINGTVHPSFSSILKNLSPIDASVFRLIARNRAISIVTLQFYNNSTGENITFDENTMLFNSERIKEPSALDTLERFGLIKILPDASLTANNYSNEYATFEESDDIEFYKREIPADLIKKGLNSFKLVKGHIKLTALGERFSLTVLDLRSS